MEKINKEELADKIVQATLEYTELYSKSQKTDMVDKQLWAALHIGVLTGLKLCGYTEQETDEVIDLVQEKMKAWSN